MDRFKVSSYLKNYNINGALHSSMDRFKALFLCSFLNLIRELYIPVWIDLKAQEPEFVCSLNTSLHSSMDRFKEHTILLFHQVP